MTRSRIFKLALPAVAVLGAGTAVAIAAIPSRRTASSTAVAERRPAADLGQLRVIDAEATPPQTCATNEAT